MCIIMWITLGLEGDFMQTELFNYWEKAKDLLKEEITGISYKTWIEPLEPVSIQNNQVSLKASSRSAAEFAG